MTRHYIGQSDNTPLVYHTQIGTSKEDKRKIKDLFSLTQCAMDTFPATLLNGQLLRKTLKHIHTCILDPFIQTGLRELPVAVELIS